MGTAAAQHAPGQQLGLAVNRRGSGHTPEGKHMKSASELLEAYLNNVSTPKVSAAQFAEDGVLELPWVQARAQGPAAVEKLLTSMLAKVPDFRFKNLTYFIQTPDKVAAEYQVEAKVLSTEKIYKQTYAGVLHAQDGKIKLLREALDTAAATKAFSKD
jgi:ketosteroid isomerase-like protein